MRLRIPELFTERQQTAYRVAKNSDGRLTEATLYRMVREEGRVKFVSCAVLQALCDVLEIEPSQLFAYQRQALKPSRRKARG